LLTIFVEARPETCFYILTPTGASPHLRRVKQVTAMTRRDFTAWEVQSSYKVNTLLARALFTELHWGQYDRFQAHTWALRVISADPRNGSDLSASIMNFDHAADAARAKYEHNKTHRQACDRAFAAYREWKATNERKAA
jgi:hypothetical protein